MTYMSQMGHNLPPLDADPIRDRLDTEFAPLRDRRDAILESAKRCPLVITTDDEAGKVGDFVKQIQACIKSATTSRTAEKEPYLQGGRSVDGWFKAISEPLTEAKADIESRLSKYLRQKADEERRRLEAEARAAAEAAAKAEIEARAAEAAIKDDDDLETAIAAAETANRAKTAQDAIYRAATSKDADLSRTRGDYGSTTSLKTEWTFSDLNSDALDLDTLRPYLPMEALEKAVRAFIRAGGRNLRGVTIAQTTKAAVR